MRPISSSTTREGGRLPPAPGSWCRVVRRREEHAKNNLPDLLIRWRRRDGSEQPFTVPNADIPARGYDLSLNRYQEVDHKAVVNRPPSDILRDLQRLDEEITDGTAKLKGMLS
ncbi:hypothetical protein [Streptomyces sp. WM6378]|uniref:hypothetical protein n=1 Tax=Streptomyces sp. WM6378 TaxID=1415557 RepID=UPI0006AF9C8C|nr:hypothetical protein [Streptomyces sp. WM6378]KOU43605.1 hypothetical protein ADK54_17605 [Streptomyces sp. WM6378]